MRNNSSPIISVHDEKYAEWGTPSSLHSITKSLVGTSFLKIIFKTLKPKFYDKI